MQDQLDFSNELKLQDALEKGNADALAYLMDTYHQPLCLYVYSLSSDHEQAKDIVQSVFLKVWEERHKVKTVKSLGNYLYKSVYNRFSNQWRKDKRMLRIEERHLEALNEIVMNDDREVLQRQIELVKSEIQNLPPKCKQTLLLSKQEGLTNIEIAAFMNVSIRTVESHMNKAFKLLRERLHHKIRPILFLLLGIDLEMEKQKVKPGFS